jgi:hypothetical protein
LLLIELIDDVLAYDCFDYTPKVIIYYKTFLAFCVGLLSSVNDFKTLHMFYIIRHVQNYDLFDLVKM